MQEQLFKMAAAALGISPETVAETISRVMNFIETSEQRISAIELQTADIHRMTRAIHVATCADVEAKGNGGISCDDDGRGSIDSQ